MLQVAHLGVAHIVEQVVLAAGELGHLVHALLDQLRHSLVRWEKHNSTAGGVDKHAW